ncbi:PAS domain-containing protein [Streptomyces sp. GESEQ-4]|uniref:hybrid sensor histidine kinase/response regulator n=1 Tax=Streptomyces sp. GESEQ-4 TaxID=2812655 RepID=UPI001B335032|nr:PAS domain-containing protein [Streptomyces sp. GESEQ-4]
MSSRPSRGAARLAAILDALPDALVLVNANGTVVNANTIALEAFETPGTALVGRGLLDLLPEFDSKLIPGSMRRPDHMDPRGRTKPTRMIARRTDGTEFPVEVTSANLENGQQAYDGYGYTSDELLMLVVRDLSGTVDTEAELARSQRQTEMILRAASEGVVGTDTDGRIVLVNPAAAQILGYRASDLGGRELHDLMLHSRADGTPFPYAESPLADTLRSGRKHRVRGQVLWSKKGEKVPVDLTTAPVRDGDQLVGAVLTFTDRRPYDSLAEEKATADKSHAEELERLGDEHASDLTALRQQHVTELEELREQHEEELAAGEDRYAALAEREKDRFEALAGRHEQLLTLLGRSLRGPLDELRRELSALAADDAGQLWPEANQVLHHLSAGYSRITQLIDNVLAYQLIDAGSEQIVRTKVMLDAVVAAGVDGAVELIGPGRVQFAVHAPPIEAEVDAARLATALAHLVADVAGVDATGNSPVSTGGYMDNTVVVAAAQRGEVVRIEVRGPYAGGDPVHEPIVRGIVRAHGGVLQTHEVPGMSGSAFVLEVPIGGGAGAVPASDAAAAEPQEAEQTSVGGRRRARRSSVDAFLESDVPGGGGESGGSEGSAPTGRRRRRAVEGAGAAAGTAVVPAQASGDGAGGTGRRRGRPAEGAVAGTAPGAGLELSAGVSEGAVVTAAEHAAGAAASGSGLGGTVPPQGVPTSDGGGALPAGQRAQQALPAALPASPNGTAAENAQPTGRRRRALAAASERAAAQEAAPRAVFALPPADADRAPVSAEGQAPVQVPAPGAAGDAVVDDGRHDSVPHDQSDDHTPPQPHPTNAPTGRRRRAVAQPAAAATAAAAEPTGAPVQQGAGQGVPVQAGQAVQVPAGQPVPQLMPQGQPVSGHAPQGQPVPTPHAIEGAASAGQPVPGQPGVSPLAPSTQAGVPGAPQPGQAAAPGQPAGGQPSVNVAPQGAAAQPQAVPTAAPGQPVQAGPATQQPVPAQAGPAPAAQAAASAAPPAQGAPGAPAQNSPAPQPGLPAPQPGLPAPQTTGVQPSAPGPHTAPGQPLPAEAAPGGVQAGGPQGTPAQPWPGADSSSGAGAPVPANGAAPAPMPPNPTGAAVPPNGAATPVPPNAPLPPENAAVPQRAAQPLPAEAAAAAPVDPNSTQGRAISVRTLGQGVPFSRQAAQVQQAASAPAPPQTSGGRRRKLGTPPDRPDQAARSHPSGEQTSARGSRLAQSTEAAGRSYAIGAPDENAAEGPEPLDGPGGAVEVKEPPRPQPMDDELPPEPLDNPRRLLVWPAPDVTTQQALSDRGYRPVIVNSREEVDAQIAAFPAALFVDPLTGPITRTALQSLRQAAGAAQVPVMVTAGLGQATREAAYGADPAVLLKALTPRDSEQHPPRVLLIEEHAEIALALTATLERRGMQVARAASDADAVTLAGQFRPNLVVMDLMQVHRRQSGIVDWLRANGQLNRTPLVVYTAAVDQADLPRLASGETVLFLAERSTSTEVQSRIVDLLARIGTN